jgi:predicted unusual protein kinase regulating ubiquinone biosynthesis (AarF/ABC1/UbiB family)
MAHRTLSLAQRLYRARRIGTTFTRIYLGIKAHQLMARHLAPPDMKQRWSRFNLESAHDIYEAAVELRGLILKGCQFIGSRADVLPPEYVEVLSRLQDRVPPRPFAVVQRIVESELSLQLEDVFEFFSPEPVASASLAQVHEARLLGGERVAVKVQYPEIDELVRSDISNLRALFRAVGIVERDFDLMPLVEELATHVPHELDFVSEAHNAETVARLFKGRHDIYVPRIHWECTCRRVLVMEFIEGIKISDTAALRAAGVDPNQLMRTLIEAYCEQVFTHGLFHADPHPGNLMVQPSTMGDPDSHRNGDAARIVFLDFGLTKYLPPGFHRGVVAVVTALVRDRADDLAEALLDLGFETRHRDPESLYEIAHALLDVTRQLRHGSSLNTKIVTQAREDLPRLVRENPIVRTPSHVVLLARVIALLSGLGHTLGAHLDILETILPYALSMGRNPATSRHTEAGESDDFPSRTHHTAP